MSPPNNPRDTPPHRLPPGWRTCVGTRVEVAGAIFDAEAVAVFASVLGRGVVALPLGQLNSPAAAPRTTGVRTPGPPASVHLDRVKPEPPCVRWQRNWENPFGRGGGASHLDPGGGVLVGAGPPVADPAVAAAGPVRPGEVSGLADQLALGFPSAPQLGAGLHEGAGLGAGPEGQLALAVQVVAEPGEAVGQRELLLGLVQQTVPCRRHTGQRSNLYTFLISLQLYQPTPGS